MEQRSAEWFAARAGKATASRICDVMARTKTGWGAARRHYFEQLVAERIIGQSLDKKYIASLEKRSEMEPEARTAYEFYSGNEVELVGFIDHPTIPNAGASPDGLIGLDGGLEVKCCDTTTHIDTLIAGAIDKDYIKQIQFGIACTERDWWDFVSYDPNMPEEGKLFIQRVHRDDAQIAEIESAVIEFLAEVDSKVEQVKIALAGESITAAALQDSLRALRQGDVL